jgi:hypothetical protein
VRWRRFLSKLFRKVTTPRLPELARILERTWDAAEEHGGDTSLGKRNKGLFEQIDEAMDVFIKPLINSATKIPDSAVVKRHTMIF